MRITVFSALVSTKFSLLTQDDSDFLVSTVVQFVDKIHNVLAYMFG
jgi:hypothetical protein